MTDSTSIRKALLRGTAAFNFKPGMTLKKTMWLRHCGCWGETTTLQEAGHQEVVDTEGFTCPACMAQVLHYEDSNGDDTARQETFEI